MSPKPRVLVVDDSAFVRKVMREVLSSAGFDVIDHARDGLEALEKIEELHPDVVTLDLMMPELDGLAVLEELARRKRAPAVVIVTTAGAGSDAGVRGLQLGAVALVEKPTALASGRLYEVGEALAREVRLAATARTSIQLPLEIPSEPPVLVPRRGADVCADLIVVGTSTGGPHALTRLLAALPSDLEAPVAIALHIPPGYTEALAARLDRCSPLRVREASEGLVLEPGTASIGRSGRHMTVERHERRLEARLGLEPLDALHRPSVDVLFESAARTCGARVIGVVLTGMGNDGLEGSRALRERGAIVLTESESSCVVWGMPRSVWQAGLANEQHPLPALPSAILRHLRAE